MKQGRWIKLSTTFIEILNMFKVDESVRVSESAREWAVKQGRWIKLSTTLIEILNMFKVDKSVRESVRVHKSGQ